MQPGPTNRRGRDRQYSCDRTPRAARPRDRRDSRPGRTSPGPGHIRRSCTRDPVPARTSGWAGRRRLRIARVLNRGGPRDRSCLTRRRLCLPSSSCTARCWQRTARRLDPAGRRHSREGLRERGQLIVSSRGTPIEEKNVHVHILGKVRYPLKLRACKGDSVICRAQIPARATRHAR